MSPREVLANDMEGAVRRVSGCLQLVLGAIHFPLDRCTDTGLVTGDGTLPDTGGIQKNRAG
jgi:hypothetical protein